MTEIVKIVLACVRRQRRFLGSVGSMALLYAVLATDASAQVVSIPAVLTSLTSTTDRIISYRHQEHMWQTADGATHLFVNRGLYSPTSSLVLFSSFDGGRTWQSMLRLSRTNSSSTSDGVLVDNNLSIVYSSLSGEILYSLLRYDPVKKQWSLRTTETVAAIPGATLLNPACALDALGNGWCAYVRQDQSSLDTSIRMAYRPTGARAWEDTGLIFGQIDSLSIERSARPVTISGGVGMVFSVHESIYWATRANEWSALTPWTVSTLFTAQPPIDTDPYASHFSIVADDYQNLHLVTVDKGHVLYFRFLQLTQMWDPVVDLTGFLGAGWVQATMSRGNLMLFANTFLTFVRVYQSADQGNSFTSTHLLTHDPAPRGSNITYNFPRIETPAISTDPVPVLQQYAEGSVQKLMFFQVPVVNPQVPE